jgi:Fe-S-cluster containining protein
MYKQFRCVDGCSDCCIYRQYFPSIEYGKTGVLLLPHEKSKIEESARRNNLEIKILPRVGIGRNSLGNGPEEILIYQIMGRDDTGDNCPFLDTYSDLRAPNGGYRCIIYEERPLACRAYPVTENTNNRDPVLDSRCQFCTANLDKPKKGSLISELAALRTIKRQVRIDTNTPVWRYATHLGEERDSAKFFPEGWLLQDI